MSTTTIVSPTPVLFDEARLAVAASSPGIPGRRGRVTPDKWPPGRESAPARHSREPEYRVPHPPSLLPCRPRSTPAHCAPSFPSSKATWIQITQLGIMEEHDAEDDKREHDGGK
jgi:hypothetical protein